MSNFKINFTSKIKSPKNNIDNFLKELKTQNNISKQSTNKNNKKNLNINNNNNIITDFKNSNSLKNDINNKQNLNNQKYFQKEELENLKNNIIELNEQLKKKDNIIQSLEQKLNSINQDRSKSLPDRELNKINIKNNDKNYQNKLNKLEEEKESIYSTINNIIKISSNYFHSKNDSNNMNKNNDNINTPNFLSINSLPYNNLIEQKKQNFFQIFNQDVDNYNKIFKNNIGDKDTKVNPSKNSFRKFLNNIPSNKINNKSPIQRDNKDIILENNNNNVNNKNQILQALPYNYFRNELVKKKEKEKEKNKTEINNTDNNIYYNNNNNNNLNLLQKINNEIQKEEHKCKLINEQKVKENKKENIITNDIKSIILNTNNTLQKKSNNNTYSLNKSNNDKKMLLNKIIQISQNNKNINKEINIINMKINHLKNNSLNQNKNNNANSYSNSINKKKSIILENKKLNSFEDKVKNLKQKNVNQKIKNNIPNISKLSSKKENKLLTNNIIPLCEGKAKTPNMNPNFINNNLISSLISHNVKNSVSPLKLKDFEIKNNNENNNLIIKEQKQINNQICKRNFNNYELFQKNSNGSYNFQNQEEQNLNKSLNKCDINQNEYIKFDVFKSFEIENKQIIKKLNENINENDIINLNNNDIEDNKKEKNPINNDDIIISNNNNEEKMNFPKIESQENNNYNQNLSPKKTEISFHSSNISGNENFINENSKKEEDSVQIHIEVESKSELSKYEEESSSIINPVFNFDQYLAMQKEIKEQNIHHQISTENINNLIEKNDKNKNSSNNTSLLNSKILSNNTSIIKSINNNNLKNIESSVFNSTSNLIDSNFDKKNNFDEPRASFINNCESRYSEFMSDRTLSEIQLAVNDLEIPKNFDNLDIIKEKFIKYQTPQKFELAEEIKNKTTNFKLNKEINDDYKNSENKENQNSTNFNSEKNKNISNEKRLNEEIIIDQINDMKKNNNFILETNIFKNKCSSDSKNKKKRNKSFEQNKLSKSFDGYYKYTLDDNKFSSNNKNYIISFTKQKKLSEYGDYRYNIKFNSKEKQKCLSISNINDLIPNKILFSIFDEKRIVSFNIITKTFSIDEFIDDTQYKFKFNYLELGSLLLNSNNCLYIVTGNNFNMFYKYNPYMNNMKFIGKLNYNHVFGGLCINSKKEIFCLSGNFNKKIEKYDNKLNIWLNNKEEMNFERSESSFIFINDKYIFSFFGYNVIQNKYLNSIEFCDVSNENMKWNLIPNIINENNFCTDIKGHSIIKNDKNNILIFGGFNGRNNKANNLFIEANIDLENNKIILDEAKENFSLIPNNKIYNFSYYNEINFVNNNQDLYLFDRKNNIILFNIDKNKMDIFYLD